MNIKQAESVIDDLNTVFAGGSTSVPSLDSVCEAIECITAEIDRTGAEIPMDVPKLSEGNAGTLAINARSAQLASDLLDFAKQCIAKDRLRSKLERDLSENHVISKRLKI